MKVFQILFNHKANEEVSLFLLSPIFIFFFLSFFFFFFFFFSRGARGAAVDSTHLVWRAHPQYVGGGQGLLGRRSEFHGVDIEVAQARMPRSARKPGLAFQREKKMEGDQWTGGETKK
jgi:hypothetical protein